jgi:hypothetical protein
LIGFGILEQPVTLDKHTSVYGDFFYAFLCLLTDIAAMDLGFSSFVLSLSPFHGSMTTL